MRFHELTTLRFFAAAIVVFYHFGAPLFEIEGFFASGPAMVTFFFVLSGFVLGVSYLKRDVDLVSFWRARAARIAPIYVLAVLISAKWGITQEAGSKLIGLGLNLTFLQAWFPDYALSVNPPGWSLSVEVFFYALFPFILLAIKKFRLRWKGLLVFSLCLWLIGLLVVFYGFSSGKAGEPFWVVVLNANSPPTHLSSFLLGIVGALWFLEYKPRITSNWLSLIVVGLPLLCVVVILNSKEAIDSAVGLPVRYGSGLLAPLFGIMVPGVAACRSRLVGLLAWRPLVVLGDASYSIYILQYPIIGLYMNFVYPNVPLSLEATFALYSVLLVLISIATFYLVERPLSRLLRGRRKQHSS